MWLQGLKLTDFQHVQHIISSNRSYEINNISKTFLIEGGKGRFGNEDIALNNCGDPLHRLC